MLFHALHARPPTPLPDPEILLAASQLLPRLQDMPGVEHVSLALHDDTFAFGIFSAGGVGPWPDDHWTRTRRAIEVESFQFLPRWILTWRP